LSLKVQISKSALQAAQESALTRGILRLLKALFKETEENAFGRKPLYISCRNKDGGLFILSHCRAEGTGPRVRSSASRRKFV